MLSKRMIFVVSSMVLITSGPAFAQARELWTNSEVGGILLIAEDFDQNGTVEILCTKISQTILLSGKKGDIADTVDASTNSAKFGDVTGDGQSDIVMSAPRLLTGGDVLLLKTRSWGGWKEQTYWDTKSTSVLILYDFTGDGVSDILARERRSLILINPATRVTAWRTGAGSDVQAVLADVSGSGRPDIAAIRWIKTRDGRYVYRDRFTSFRYDFALSFVDPKTGDTVKKGKPFKKPTRPPIAADLSGTGSDDIVVFTEDELFIFREGETKNFEYVIEVEHSDEEMRALLGNNIEFPSDVESAEVKLGFLSGAVGDFHSSDGLEIVVVTALGDLIALSAQGEILWEQDV